MKNVNLRWLLGVMWVTCLTPSFATNCENSGKRNCYRIPAQPVGTHSNSGAAEISTTRNSVFSNCTAQTTVTFTGLTTLTTETCSPGYYENLENQTRLGLTAGELTLFRALKAENKLTVAFSSTECPTNDNSYNFILLRGHAPDDFSDPVDYSGDGGYVGGVLHYTSSPGSSANILTGTKKFNLKSPAIDNNPFNFKGYREEICNPSGTNPGVIRVEEANNEPQGGSDNPFIDKYMTVSFGSQAGSFTTSSPNPFVGILAPVSPIPNGFWAADSIYTGLYTVQEKALVQQQEVLYVKTFADPAGNGNLKLYKANTCEPGSAGCSPKGRYLNNPQERTEIGLLTCNHLNEPSEGFCRGELSLNGITPKGNAVCLPIAQISDHSGNKDMIFCAAQYPGDKRALVSFVFAATSESVVGVQILDENGVIEGEQHLDSATANKQIKVKISNLTARAVNEYQLTALGSPFSQTPRDPNVSITSFGSLSEGCGTSLPPFSSCVQTVEYSPSASGIHLASYMVTYDNGSKSVGASAELKASKSLQAIRPLGSSSGSAIFQSLYSPVSLSAQACLGGNLASCSNESIPSGYLNWSASGAGSLGSNNSFSFTSTEGSVQLTSDLWSGQKTGSVTLIPFNPSTISLLTPPSQEGKLEGDKSEILVQFNSVVHETTEAMPLSPVLPILSP